MAPTPLAAAVHVSGGQRHRSWRRPPDFDPHPNFDPRPCPRSVCQNPRAPCLPAPPVRAAGDGARAALPHAALYRATGAPPSPHRPRPASPHRRPPTAMPLTPRHRSPRRPARAALQAPPPTPGLARPTAAPRSGQPRLALSPLGANGPPPAVDTESRLEGG
jgi:hypothetical protein